MNETYNSIARDFKNTKSEIAFTKLYYKMQPVLKNYIRNIVKDPDVTEDLLAKTFNKIYEKIYQYDDGFSITTWAYTIAKRECLRWIKRERNPKISLSYFSEFGSEAINDDDDNLSMSKIDLIFEDKPYKTEEQFLYEDNILQNRYDKAVEIINSLKPIYRDILIDIIFNRMKYKEVAYKYDKELQDIQIKFDNATDDEKIKMRKKLESVYKKALQRVKNRVRRGKSLVANELINIFPSIKNDMNI